jgi:hypothetical protein
MKLKKQLIKLSVRHDKYPNLPVVSSYKGIKYVSLEHPAMVDDSGIFAIHKCLHDTKKYVITHVPSGMTVTRRTVSLFEARDALEKALSLHPDAVKESEPNPRVAQKSKVLKDFAYTLIHV